MFYLWFAYILKLKVKFLHSYWHIPLLSASTDPVGAEAQHSSESSWFFFDDWLFKWGRGRFRWRRWGGHHSDQLGSVFRGWRPGRRPAAAAAAAARHRRGPSAGPGLNWGLRSRPAPSRSAASHTAAPCSPRGSYSGGCWCKRRHFGSAGVHCHTPGLWWEQCRERRQSSENKHTPSGNTYSSHISTEFLKRVHISSYTEYHVGKLSRNQSRWFFCGCLVSFPNQ